MFGGLTNAEWQVWRQTGNYINLQTVLTAEDEEDFAAFTGLVPYFIKKIAEYSLPSYAKRMAKWQEDPEPGGGKWIKNALKKFAISVEDLDEHMTTMMDVLANPGEVAVAADNYNHQFFGETLTLPPNLIPICGFISVAIMKAFQEVDEIRLKAKISHPWIASIFRNANINASMRGFYFETYCLHFIKDHLKHLFGHEKGFSAAIDNAKIIPFAKDYPTSTVVATPDNINAIYWPSKWNLRYVDMVVRLHVKSTAALTGLHIMGVQVTLQNPGHHLNSLDFFTHLRQGTDRIDYQRYLTPDDLALPHRDMKFHLLWFLPAAATVVIPPHFVRWPLRPEVEIAANTWPPGTSLVAFKQKDITNRIHVVPV
jgi:hypothetical protein